MQKFMKRWHKRNSPGCSSGEEEEKGEKGEKAEKLEESGEKEKCNEEECLISNMLGPFGK